MDKDLEKLLANVRENMTLNTSATNGQEKLPDGNKTVDIDTLRKQREKLEYAGIYKRYQGVTVEAIEKRGLPSSENIVNNWERVKEYIATLDFQISHGYGLILAGQYGTMKTTMAVAILRKWIDTDHNGLLVPMCSVIDNLFTLRTTNREEWAKYEYRLRSTPLLILDDLGGEETDKSWVLAKVDSIITERYNKMLSTIITTNLTQAELAGTYSGRIMDRLRNTSKYLSFNEKSQRRVMQ